jgi:hypothetical protein
MDDERKKWSEQYNNNTGPREIFRFGCALMIWMFFGVAITLAFEFAGFHATAIIIFTIFFISMFVLPIIFLSWKPGYAVLRKILGNKNIPVEPMPRSTMKLPREPRPWQYYLLVAWRYLILLILLYAVVKWLLK